MAQLLVIDDDRSIIDSFRILFEGTHSVIGAYNGTEALQELSEHKVDLIFLDYRLPGQDGLEVLNLIQDADPDACVVIISGYGNFETIIKSISLGAYDYIEKPLDSEKIRLVTERVLESRKISAYMKHIKDTEIDNYHLSHMIGKSVKMQEVFKAVGRLVNNDVSVLITGESGTGKELIAKSIHYNSPRKNDPFIAVNCSGITETLLNNELFGHEAQAFTGADSRKRGKFEAAGEGTIFLDEIGDMPYPTQSTLLRVLQEREFTRLGGTQTIRLKARIIAATNKNLLDEMKKNRFRQDLYYRVNVASIDLPPLRERKEDIPPLVDYFIQLNCKKIKKTIRGISDNALRTLECYDWPGNVRELENVLTNVCIHLQDNYIHSLSIPSFVSGGGKETDMYDEFVMKVLQSHEERKDLLKTMTSRLEERLIERVAEMTRGNKSQMAKILGISRVTLQKKLRDGS
jgi:DNA-binding NtrC family response regulator